MKRLNVMIQCLQVTESHLADRVAKGTTNDVKGLQHDFIQLYRTRNKLIELRRERGDEECLTN